MTDPAAEICMTCGAGPVEKLLFPVAVHFKGSGFYSTDYGRGARTAAGSEGEAAATGDKAGSDKGTSDKSSTEKKASADTG